jgi:hypothetical protein
MLSSKSKCQWAVYYAFLPPVTLESIDQDTRKSVETLSHQMWHYFKSLTAMIYI